MAGLNKHGACGVGEVANAALSDAILMAPVDAAKGNSLVGGLLHFLAEGLGCKGAIASMVVAHRDAVLGGKTFKSAFCAYSFKGRGGLLWVDKVEPGVVVHDHGGTGISVSG
jgi:hypothetical protein